MSKGDLLEFVGIVEKALGGGQYQIAVDGGTAIRARLAGRMKQHHVNIMPGDRVTVAVSPYDPSHGIVVHRG